MTDPQWIWLASIFVASITANAGLLKIVTDDKIKRPNVVAIILNFILSCVGSYFAYQLVGGIPAIIFFVFNFALFLVLIYFIKRRDVKAVLFGEKLLSEFQTIDIQICFILSEMYERPNGDLVKPIRQTLRYILSVLQNIFGLDNSHHAQLCILVPSEFKFRVIAYEGISPVKLKQMQDSFRYGVEPNSLAGHAVNRRIPIIINDLANEKDENAKYFITLSHDEAKRGSILIYPIIRGIGSDVGVPIALICITSDRKNAFDIEVTKQILSYFATKVEVLQNCMDIASVLKKE
ncbi:MAG: GAF domain-containing protein [Methylococcales bacterium]|nr:GAF domain-containing protein [Methylococcales bacterium]